MDLQDVYRDLSKKLLLEHSAVLPRIWKTVCSEDEARVVNALPATARELAEKFGTTEHDMLAILDNLFHKGAVFEAVKDGVTTYRMPRHIIQFHDATILWKEAPQELMNLWMEFEHTDYPMLLELVAQIKMPSFMRVIPIGESITPRNQVLAHEDALGMLEAARVIAVTDCACRTLLRRCDHPLTVCVQINRGAEYAIKRGTGRRIGASEARELLELSRKAGLVHMTENTAGRSNVICNCCSCCCEMLRFATDEKTRRAVLSPSRYQAHLDKDACTACGLCADICPVKALGSGDGDTMLLDADACIGCGLCGSVCPVGAVTLVEVRPPDFIPA
ncbi:MAG: ATP-binding protein [Desulfomonilia bacterium]|jgi:ferredoxin|nr:4Fe-4S binding protein [Desulfomonilia bacterium]HPW67915.1 4Fe-4S binding protein [Deltaproteobacteria bacterium]